MGWKLKEYIPDFTYKVIRLHDFTNEDIKKHMDEMSLVMMFNKIQSPKDYTDFLQTSQAYMEEVLKDTPQELLRILMDVFWALLMKMNVPQEEAEELMDQMEAKKMGYLFENAEKMDIQKERRNTEEAQKKAEEAEKKADEANKKVDEANKKVDEANKKAEEAYKEADEANKKVDEANKKVNEANKKVDEAEKQADEASKKAVEEHKKAEEAQDSIKSLLGTLVELCKKDSLTKGETKDRLRDLYKIKETDLTAYFEEIWNNTVSLRGSK